MRKIKLIPLVIAVIILSFSIRVIDLLSDIPHFSGTVQAEEVQEEPVMPEEPLQPADGLALEESDGEQQAEPEQSSEEANGDPGVVWRNPTGEDPRYDEVRGQVFEDLTNRRKAIEQQEKRLAAREALVRAAEQEVDQKIAEMNQLREKLENLLEQQTEKEREQIERLVTIYEGMKAKDAARIFDGLDLDVLVEVATRMSERKLSPILAAMSADRAKTVTIMLAERNTLDANLQP